MESSPSASLPLRHNRVRRLWRLLAAAWGLTGAAVCVAAGVGKPIVPDSASGWFGWVELALVLVMLIWAVVPLAFLFFGLIWVSGSLRIGSGRSSQSPALWVLAALAGLGLEVILWHAIQPTPQPGPGYRGFDWVWFLYAVGLMALSLLMLRTLPQSLSTEQEANGR
jgi:hypothetical protein